MFNVCIISFDPLGYPWDRFIIYPPPPFLDEESESQKEKDIYPSVLELIKHRAGFWTQEHLIPKTCLLTIICYFPVVFGNILANGRSTWSKYLLLVGNIVT